MSAVQPDWVLRADGRSEALEKWQGRKTATRLIRVREARRTPIDDVPSDLKAFIARWAQRNVAAPRVSSLMDGVPLERIAFAEQALDTLFERGWVELVERYKNGTWVRDSVRFTDLETLRKDLGIGVSAAAWRAACETIDWLPGSAWAALAAREHNIGKRSPAEVLEGWKRLIAPPMPAVYVRDAASLCFWRLSKALDDRVDLVNQVRVACGLSELLESKLQLLNHVPQGWETRGVLFIENATVFENARAGELGECQGLALVFSAGFRASGARIRSARTASLYPDDQSFGAWLFSSRTDVPTFFWGDLDFSGMGILRGLKTVFPDIRAWEPGYGAMLEALRAGEGHLPEEADKADQLRPDSTGCFFADAVLLPALDAYGRFLDQEGFLNGRPSQAPKTPEK